MSKESSSANSSESKAGGRRPPGAVTDWVAGIVIAVVSTAAFAILGDGVRLELLLFAAAYTALIMFLVVARGWRLGAFVRRLREKPNHLPSR